MLAKLESLRLHAVALRSTIHNEHMLNAQELCGMVSKKTNEIIDVVNELVEEIKRINPQIDVEYNSENEEVEIN